MWLKIEIKQMQNMITLSIIMNSVRGMVLQQTHNDQPVKYHTEFYCFNPFGEVDYLKYV